MKGYERLPVEASPEATVKALRRALADRGITEYAVVDHGADMAAAGAPRYPAWTLVFGSPAVGARLLAVELAAAIDIPLRLAVIGVDEGRSEIILRDMRSILPDHLADLADGFTSTLRTLAVHARGLTESPRHH